MSWTSLSDNVEDTTDQVRLNMEAFKIIGFPLNLPLYSLYLLLKLALKSIEKFKRSVSFYTMLRSNTISNQTFDPWT